jgi:hypothetical protein
VPESDYIDEIKYEHPAHSLVNWQGPFTDFNIRYDLAGDYDAGAALSTIITLT